MAKSMPSYQRLEVTAMMETISKSWAHWLSPAQTT
jgi:hypothetical protein